MEKRVKDVFLNCSSQYNNFCNAEVEEIKFSKKLNAVILNAKSDLNIALSDIEEFENQAKNAYKLSSFKVNYRYIGNPCDIDEKDIKESIRDINKKYSYTQDVFENCKIQVDNIDNEVNITLMKPLSSFMKIKKIDEYIKKQIETKNGKTINVTFSDDKNVIQDESNYTPEMIKYEDLVNIPTNSTMPPHSNDNVKNNQNEKKKFIKRPLTEAEKEYKERI